jgi:hypothetical protein
VLAVVVAAGVCRAGLANAQESGKLAPLQLTSVEWWVAGSGVIVRGVVTDVTAEGNWNIVTLDVREILKGDKADRLKFAVHKLDQTDAALGKWQKSQRELLWVLKSQESGVPGEAPDREKAMAKHKVVLHAPFVSGRPGEPALPVIPLGQAAADEGHQSLAMLTVDLQLLKTSDQFVKAIQTALAEPEGCPCEAPVPYSLSLPQEIAQRTGFSRAQNHLIVPTDHRLEELARRLVQSPRDFLAANDPDHRYTLRLEGVKTLRLFRSEKNLAIVRDWLDSPLSKESFAGANTLVPAAPKLAEQKIVLPTKLTEVPEISFQKPLTKAINTTDAQLHTAVTIDCVHLLNQKKTDAFIETMMKKRPDLAGLDFAMGAKCRMKPEAGKQFVAALDVFRKAETAFASQPALIEDQKEKKQPAPKGLIEIYKEQLGAQKIDPAASVNSLMQVLGHEDAKARLGLATYLEGVKNADATRALARLAIFSEESEIREAAINALRTRDAKDYTEILVSGLNYPWPAVADRASDAIVKLERKDLADNLINVLESPDPRAPQVQEVEGKKVTMVRELVRLNHHHNCVLCHAPARDNSKEETAKLEGLTAQVPVPSESMVAYYRPSVPDILVRFDVTYLRQDFSMKVKVADADPWPEMQRYDFLVRSRVVSADEARAYCELLEPSGPNAMSPYRTAAHLALRRLTGLDTEPSAEAWRESIGQ